MDRGASRLREAREARSVDPEGQEYSRNFADLQNYLRIEPLEQLFAKGTTQLQIPSRSWRTSSAPAGRLAGRSVDREVNPPQPEKVGSS